MRRRFLLLNEWEKIRVRRNNKHCNALKMILYIYIIYFQVTSILRTIDTKDVIVSHKEETGLVLRDNVFVRYAIKTKGLTGFMLQHIESIWEFSRSVKYKLLQDTKPVSIPCPFFYVFICSLFAIRKGRKI